MLTSLRYNVERSLIAAPLNLLVRWLIRLSHKDTRGKLILERDVVTRDYPFHVPALVEQAGREEETMYLAALRVSIVQMELTKRAVQA